MSVLFSQSVCLILSLTHMCSVSLPVLLFWSAHLASNYHVFISMWLIALSCPLLQETLSYHQRWLRVLWFARYAFAQNPCLPKPHFEAQPIIYALDLPFLLSQMQLQEGKSFKLFC